jgi:hypothetical protein
VSADALLCAVPLFPDKPIAGVDFMTEEYLQILGTEMKDKVTGITGMVSSVCFDAYGCVQACLTQRKTKSGTIPDQYWMDIKRLAPSGKRLMPVPRYTRPGTEIGAADKPVPRQ